jgi:hypothetical protein
MYLCRKPNLAECGATNSKQQHCSWRKLPHIMSAARRLSDTMYYVTSLANGYNFARFRQVQLLTSVTQLLALPA